jgi:ribose transport system ATP-binding protein
VKILSGVLAPDAGEVVAGGSPISHFAPGTARGHGVATVFQELLNVPGRSAVDNIFLGEDFGFRHSRNRGARLERARLVLERLGVGRIDVSAPVGILPLSVQQQVAIARALQRSAQILVLDEATSALDVQAQEQLFVVLREELARGVLVLFITHRMNEIMTLADEVTVLCSGTTVAVVGRDEIRPDLLLGLMSRVPTSATGGGRVG